jgi:16S rRNA (guanine527-N7)-methyltransferase
MNALGRFCESRGLPWSTAIDEHFRTYRDLLVQFNEAMNLIGPLSPDEIEVELLLDSVVAAAARAPRGPILDVGTGAGLPGIPLKILFPELPITLVEPRRKRATFLKICTHRLALTQVTVAHCRIEDLSKDTFDFVISKAFEPPLTWLQTARPWLAPDGAALCMARRSDADALTALASRLDLTPAGTASADESSNPRVVYAFGLPSNP